MRFAPLVLMTVTLGAAAPKQTPRELTFYLRENVRVAPEVRALALHETSKMFATIGIQLKVRSGEPPHASSKRHVAVELTTDTPAHLLPGAMGFAMPFEGVHIRVFYDRIQSGVVPRGVLLGHVLAHEIAHILQGTDQHSNSGIMKAAWTHRDHLQMREGALPFTARDVELIHRGLNLLASDAPTLEMEGLDPAQSRSIPGIE